MTDHRREWRIHLTRAALDDFRQILLWTNQRFGAAQARSYGQLLTKTIGLLKEGPNIPGTRKRDEIANGLFSLHVARGGQKGRHFVIYKAGDNEDEAVVIVLRLLHDSMDIPRHFEV